MSAAVHDAFQAACAFVDGPHGILPTVAFFVVVAILTFRTHARRFGRSS